MIKRWKTYCKGLSNFRQNQRTPSAVEMVSIEVIGNDFYVIAVPLLTGFMISLAVNILKMNVMPL